MMSILFKTEAYLPYDCFTTIFDIDYNKLYENGKKIILIDIDNTIMPYDISIPTSKELELFEKIQSIGFKVIFISNNHKNRVKSIADAFNVKYVYKAYKPLKSGFRRALKLIEYSDKKEIITIGDQMITDILGSNRSKLDGILVKPIKRKNEKWYTKLNRISENRVIRKMEKKYPEIAKKIIELRREIIENKM